MNYFTLSLPLGFLVSACGTESDTPSDPVFLAPPADGVQFGQNDRLAGGDERNKCEWVFLDQDIDVGRIEHRYSTQGIHHFNLIITALSRDSAEAISTEPFACDGFGETWIRGNVMLVTNPEGEIAFPDNVALKLKKGTVLAIQTHFVNPSSDTLEVQAAVNLHRANSATTEAGVFGFYNYGMVIPANGTFTSRMECGVPSDVNVLTLLTHMHSRGTKFESWVAKADGTKVQDLASTTEWSDVPTLVLNDPLSIAKGNRIHVQCDFQNPTPEAIIQGPSKPKNEMCMLLGTYWPKEPNGFSACVDPGSGPRWEGTKPCGESLACIQAHPAKQEPEASQQCFVDTCEASSPALANVFDCIYTNCLDQCPDFAAESCTACSLTKCIAEFAACEQATCEAPSN